VNKIEQEISELESQVTELGQRLAILKQRRAEEFVHGYKHGQDAVKKETENEQFVSP